jgi:hypothetical protein
MPIARKTESEDEHIHIRVALHMGPGIEKDNDVFGDVVNATAKVQQQCEPDQVIITDVLLDIARQGGFQCAKLGRAQIKGKDEAIDVYAVAWSASANEQLVEEVQKQYETRLREARRQKELMEEELEGSREQWRSERRRLTDEIEELESELEESGKLQARAPTRTCRHSSATNWIRLSASSISSNRNWSTRRRAGNRAQTPERPDRLPPWSRTPGNGTDQQSRAPCSGGS